MWLCGQEATKHLKDFLRHRTVRCDISGKDRYGRSIGVCFAGNVNINRYMVSSGFAMAYWRYSHDCQRRTKSTALAGVKMHHLGGVKLVHLV